MFNKKNFFKKINNAKKVVDSYKEQSKSKSKNTREKYKSIAEMQKFIDESVEKRKLLIDIINNTVTDKKILEKGIVVYARLLEVISLIEEDFTESGFNFKTITGKTTTTNRMKFTEWFNESPRNKILLVSDAGGESIDIHTTNEVVLYDIPNGWRGYSQTIGRVNRGNFDCTNIHLVQIEDSMDEYLAVLISSKKELENELLHADSILLKDISSFNRDLLKAIRKKKLWKS